METRPSPARRLPVGYRRSGGGTGPRIEIDPEKGPAVKEAFELAATGRHSLGRLSGILAAKGFLAKGKPIPRSSLHDALRNPFYAGMETKGGHAAKAGHEPLVSAELFGRVQDKLSRRSRAARRSTHSLGDDPVRG